MNQELIRVGVGVHDAMLRYSRHAQHLIFPPNLSGACVLSSMLMQREAQRRGIECQLVSNQLHTYTMSEGLVYDPTAIQFLHRFIDYNNWDQNFQPKVWVGSPTDLEEIIRKAYDNPNIVFQNYPAVEIGRYYSQYALRWEGDTATLMDTTSPMYYRIPQ